MTETVSGRWAALGAAIDELERASSGGHELVDALGPEIGKLFSITVDTKGLSTQSTKDAARALGAHLQQMIRENALEVVAKALDEIEAEQAAKMSELQNRFPKSKPQTTKGSNGVTAARAARA